VRGGPGEGWLAGRSFGNGEGMQGAVVEGGVGAVELDEPMVEGDLSFGCGCDGLVHGLDGEGVGGDLGGVRGGFFGGCFAFALGGGVAVLTHVGFEGAVDVGGWRRRRGWSRCGWSVGDGAFGERRKDAGEEVGGELGAFEDGGLVAGEEDGGFNGAEGSVRREGEECVRGGLGGERGEVVGIGGSGEGGDLELE